MNCKCCNAEMAEEEKICPACGKEQEEAAVEIVEEVPAEEVAAVEETAVEEAVVEEQPAEPAKASTKKITVAVIALVLVAILCLSATGCTEKTKQAELYLKYAEVIDQLEAKEYNGAVFR